MTFQDLINTILLKEDSVENIQMIGDWDSPKQYGWSKADTGILKSTKGLEKIKTKWKIDEPVDIYLLKGKEYRKYVELGKVSFEFIRDTLKLDVPIDSDHITIFYTQNTGAEKIPATPWTLAHRFGHALARRDGMALKNQAYENLRKTIEELFDSVGKIVYGRTTKDYYSTNNTSLRKYRKELAHALGTFKSARNRNLRADFEFTNEIIAQFIITGDVKLNREFPRVLPLIYAWGKPSGYYSKSLSQEQKDDLENILDIKESELRYDISNVISDAVGNIYVM
jgi:hypothetical protein